MAGKGDLKAAAAHLERGLARLGESDLVGALVEFEKALELYGPLRGKPFADWVQKVQAATKAGGLAALDEDSLRAMNEAFDEPKSTKRPRPPQVLHQAEETRPERTRKMTPTPPPPLPLPLPSSDKDAGRPRRMTPATPIETAATMTLPQPPVATPRVTRDPGEGGESPWDPVPLTPTAGEAPPQLRAGAGARREDKLAELQSQA
ncbi:MAG TPA: hypothetical protein VGH63_00225, partial [Polyangia bacterium]